MLTNIKMIHIRKGYDVPVLVVIQGNTDLLKMKVHVELRCLVVSFVVHSNLEEPD